MDYGKGLGLEEAVRAALLILHASLNGEIDAQNSLWASRDSAFLAALGRATTSYQLEHVQDQNFYAGHVPSLIDADKGRYPNVAVMGFQVIPQGTGEDYGEQFRIQLAVEVMAKSDSSEEEVNSRILRTVDSVHRVLMSGPGRNLSNTVSRLHDVPQVVISDVFAVMETNSQERWLWQGGRLTYNVDKFATYGS